LTMRREGRIALQVGPREKQMMWRGIKKSPTTPRNSKKINGEILSLSFSEGQSE